MYLHFVSQNSSDDRVNAQPDESLDSSIRGWGRAWRSEVEDEQLVVTFDFGSVCVFAGAAPNNLTL